MKFDPSDPGRPKLERDLENEAGGAGQYSVDLQSMAGEPPLSACLIRDLLTLTERWVAPPQSATC
jgi:hypothetical protein